MRAPGGGGGGVENGNHMRQGERHIHQPQLGRVFFDITSLIGKSRSHSPWTALDHQRKALPPLTCGADVAMAGVARGTACTAGLAAAAAGDPVAAATAAAGAPDSDACALFHSSGGCHFDSFVALHKIWDPCCGASVAWASDTAGPLAVPGGCGDQTSGAASRCAEALPRIRAWIFPANDCSPRPSAAKTWQASP